MNSNKKILQKVLELETYSNLDLTDLKSMLEENIREEAVKKSKRGKSELSIIKGLMKSDFVKYRPELKDKTFITSDEFFTFTDGHRIFHTRTDLGYDIVKNPFTNFNFVYGYSHDILDNTDKVEIDIDVEDLTAYIDMVDKRNPKPYVIGFNYNDKDYMLGLNPKYLMESIKFTENNRICFVVKTNDCGKGDIIINPIYNIAKDNTDLLTKLVVTLPVNCTGCNPTKVYNVL